MGNRKELVSSLQELREDNIRKQKRGLHFIVASVFIWVTIFYKGIMPSEKVLDLPVDCNTLTGSVNL